MTDLRTAAQQALAFTMRDFASLRDFEAARAVLHDNLRAALAQQAEPVPTHRINSWGFCGVCRHDRIPGEGCARQECPDSPQQPEPVEPAAWVHTDAHNPKVRFLEWTQQAQGYRGEWIKTPLCNCAQPHRKPLTEEEIEFCRQQGYAHGGLSAPFDFGKAARAVERAHGIGRQSDPQIEDRLARHGIPKP